MTTIAPSLIITGEISSEEDITIEGHFRGAQIVLRNATLTVGQKARVEANVRSARVQVFGEVEGSINASERIELASTAAVIGDLSANQVVLADGAVFNGRIDMDRRTIASKVAQYKAAQPA